MLALTGEGWWRMALSYQATEAMTLAWFKQQGLVPATGRYLALRTEGNRRGTYNVCPVVWEEGRHEDPSYPIATLLQLENPAQRAISFACAWTLARDLTVLDCNMIFRARRHASARIPI